MKWLACTGCDLLHDAVTLGQGQEAQCVRCGTVLLAPRGAYDAQPDIALVATAGIAFAIALANPLMGLSEAGHSATTSLPRSAIGMWLAGSYTAAVLVALFTIMLPTAHLALALAAGAGTLRTPVPRWAGTAARLARAVSPWAMPEIMLLATLVAYVKVAELVHAAPELGMYATGVLVVLLTFARHAAHIPTVWSRIAAGTGRS
jgi:paraquat-inducible protein A